MFNRVILVGRMTRDPELRRTNSGSAVTSFTIALNRNYQSSDGVQADYIPCIVWNKVAENVEKYCSKGSLVGVEGRLRSRSYDNAHGQKIYVVEVVCDSVQFLERRKDTDQKQPEPAETVNDSVSFSFYDQSTADFSSEQFDITEDDIEF